MLGVYKRRRQADHKISCMSDIHPNVRQSVGSN